jgi:hypothetical protein
VSALINSATTAAGDGGSGNGGDGGGSEATAAIMPTAGGAGGDKGTSAKRSDGVEVVTWPFGTPKRAKNMLKGEDLLDDEDGGHDHLKK